jgi:hypothetical protein
MSTLENVDGFVGWRWHDFISTHALYHDYEQEMRMKGRPQFALDVVRFGQFMGRYFVQARPRGNGLESKNRVAGYRFGSLDEARDRFAAYHGLNGYDWDRSALLDDTSEQLHPDRPRPKRSTKWRIS